MESGVHVILNIIKGTLMQTWKSADIFVFTQKLYAKGFAL